MKDKKGWRVKTGVDGWTLKGRYIYILNLLKPQQITHKLRCSFKSRGKSTINIRLDELSEPYEGYGLLLILLALTLLAVIPCIVVFHLRDIYFVIAIVVNYLLILLILSKLYRNSEKLGIMKQELLMLAFECLICPPLALNAIRKLSVKKPNIEDMLNVLKQINVKPIVLDKIKDRLISSIDLEIVRCTYTGEDKTSLVERKHEICELIK